MTRPSDTEAIERLLAEHATWNLDDTTNHAVCTCGAVVLTTDGRINHRAHVASILATRLAGAGAQVTEAAVSAAAEALNGYSWRGHYVVREGTSGTPTAMEIVIREDMAPVIARAALSAAAPHMGTEQSEADLRARISALADEWEEAAAYTGNPPVTGKHVTASLRALLDRPAAEGDERLAEAWAEGHADCDCSCHIVAKLRGTCDPCRNPYRPGAAEGNET